MSELLACSSPAVSELELVSERLPELLDAKALREELGVSRAAAEAIMRQLPIVQIEDLRKVYVYRSDVAAYLEQRTFDKEQVPGTSRVVGGVTS